MSDSTVQNKDRVRIGLFLLSALAILVVLNLALRTINTLDRLEVVERERDQWQRPSEIIDALNLKTGDTAVDLGSGAGYFALKLPSAVGKQGKVFAIDIRDFPLLFVWMRAAGRGLHNVRIIHSEPENARLPAAANAVLIVNTYHEFTSRRKILDQISRSLAPGGRLVIVDRTPPQDGQASAAPGDHELPLSVASADIRQAGFGVLRQTEDFVQPPGDSSWWILVAARPN